MTVREVHRSREGQAVIEMAVVVPIMLLLTAGFLGVLVWMETITELQAGTALATTTAATFAEDSDTARAAEQDSFAGTMRQYRYVEVGTLVCSHRGTRVECSSSAVLRYDRTPLAVAWFVNVPMSARAVSYSSAFRSP